MARIKHKKGKIPFFSIENWKWYTFLIPTLICLLLMTYKPTLTALKYSFYDVSVIGYSEDFVGLRNYKALLFSSGFQGAFLNTIILIAISYLYIPISYLLAYAINSLGRTRWQAIFRTGYFFPYMVTFVSAIMIFKQVMSQNNGLLNETLSLILRKDVNIAWITDPAINKIGVSFIHFWTQMGYLMLICLAGLQSLSVDILEASEVDGASAVQRFFYIVTPNMKGSFFFLFITLTISGFARFTDLFVLSGSSSSGGIQNSLQTLIMYVYQFGFETPQFGLSSAGSMIVFVLVLIVTLVNMRITGFKIVDE